MSGQLLQSPFIWIVQFFGLLLNLLAQGMSDVACLGFCLRCVGAYMGPCGLNFRVFLNVFFQEHQRKAD